MPENVGDAGIFGDWSALLLEGDVDLGVCDLAQIKQVVEDVSDFGLGLHFHDYLLDGGDGGVGAAHDHHAHLVHTFKIIMIVM